MNKPTPKAVLWDFDGTIFDSISIMHNILDEIFPRAGIPVVDRETIRSNFYGPLEELLIRLSNDYKDQATLLTYFFEAQLRHHENAQTHTGIADAIAFFGSQGLQQAIVTSRASEQRGKTGARELVKTLQLDLHIKTVISAEDSPHHKPHPDPIHLALKNLGIDPKNAVMIGDQHVDIEAAHNAGIYGILLDNENTSHSKTALKQIDADAYCTNADELIENVVQLLEIELH